MKILIVAALLFAPAVAHAGTLELICYGTARFTEQSTGEVSRSDGWGGTADSTVTMRSRGQSNASVRVRIHDESWGEIKIPGELIPLLRSASNDGWRPLSELELTETEIRARFILNVMNKPKVLVDRRTGDMELSGWGGGFRGSCERAPDESAPKKF